VEGEGCLAESEETNGFT